MNTTVLNTDIADVASLELSQELFELTGWDDTRWCYYKIVRSSSNDRANRNLYMRWRLAWSKYKRGRESVPAYDLGYLLRKLPRDVATDEQSYFSANLYLQPHIDETWNAGYRVGASFPKYSTVAATPEDALCALAVELHKQGELPKEEAV